MAAIRVLFVLAAMTWAVGCQQGAGSTADASSLARDAAGLSPDAAAAQSPDAALAADASVQHDAGAADSGSTGRPFPDTSARIAILADQLPSLNDAQQKFVVAHYVGTQKQTLDLSRPLRALKPDFLVLHYHLAMWQSAPGVDFIVDGNSWGNDFPTVTTHEDWFWHNSSNSRVASVNDGKFLMNVSNPDFAAYWADSLAQQVAAGDYDGVFFDSASPALLNFEAQSPPDPRLAGTAVKDTQFPELGGVTWIQAWQAWIAALDTSLAAKGIPLIPNTGAFTTTWDNTNYGLTAGIFSEGFADPSFAPADWKASTNELLKLVRADKIVILQNYLSGTTDYDKRRYYLANYLLVRGQHTYLDYFSSAGPFEWYPEWDLDLGTATTTAATSVDDLLQSGVYRRDFERGVVLVNPSASPVTVDLGSTLQRVELQGGGPIDSSGNPSGSTSTSDVSSIVVPASGAEILLKP